MMKKSLIFILFIIIFLFTSCNVEIKVQTPEEYISSVTTFAPAVSESETVAATTTEEAATTIIETTTLEVTTTTEEITTTAEPETTTAAPEEPERVIVQSKKVPIFMYHTSSENNPGALSELYVKPSEFEKQVQYLAENNYTFCTFDDWYNLHNIDKPVFLTFDDGYEANYTEIFPILQQYNAKITIFLAINNMAAENFTAEMIREMSDSGLVKFESHTISHADLSAVSSDDARLAGELEDSKKQIEEITGKNVRAIAYPGGKFNAKVKLKASEYYLFGVSIIHGAHNTDYDDFEIRRFRVNRSTSLNAFIGMLG